jgi:hypothetical protein
MTRKTAATLAFQIDGNSYRTNRYSTPAALATAYGLTLTAHGHLLNKYGVFVGRVQAL